MHKRILIAAIAALLSVPAFSQGWLELPASSRNPGMGRVVLKQDIVRDGAPVRSHTYCYDPSLRVSLWVAYPLNADLIGSGSRSEGWHPSALLDERLQPNLRKGFAYGSGYDRGHQIPSADRLDRDINYETFVYINATPQRHAFNEGVWTDLERLVRTWAKRSDTLYVVTGIIPGKESIPDNDGHAVNIPEAYYKAVLRRDTDRSGRLHWSMCAVLVPHSSPSHGEWTVPQRNAYLQTFSLTVAELERAAGETFFPELARLVSREKVRMMKETPPDPWYFR